MIEIHPHPEFNNNAPHEAQWFRVWFSNNTGPPPEGIGVLQCWCGLTKPLEEAEGHVEERNEKAIYS